MAKKKKELYGKFLPVLDAVLQPVKTQEPHRLKREKESPQVKLAKIKKKQQ